MDTWKESQLESAKHFIWNHNKEKKWDKYLAIISDTKYEHKKTWEWVGPGNPPTNTTTYGRRYVRLGSTFFSKLRIEEQSSILIHEAVHCIQYDKYGGNLPFWIAYLIKGHSKDLEAEAYKIQHDFLKSVGYIKK